MSVKGMLFVLAGPDGRGAFGRCGPGRRRGPLGGRSGCRRCPPAPLLLSVLWAARGRGSGPRVLCSPAAGGRAAAAGVRAAAPVGYPRRQPVMPRRQPAMPRLPHRLCPRPPAGRRPQLIIRLSRPRPLLRRPTPASSCAVSAPPAPLPPPPGMQQPALPPTTLRHKTRPRRAIGEAAGDWRLGFEKRSSPVKPRPVVVVAPPHGLALHNQPAERTYATATIGSGSLRGRRGALQSQASLRDRIRRWPSSWARRRSWPRS